MGKYYYAVRKGRNPGIYLNWDDCEKEVKGFKEAEFKKFKSKDEALEFINLSNKNIVHNRNKMNNSYEYKIEDLKDNEMIAYIDGSFSVNTFNYGYGIVLLTRDNKEVYNGKEDNKELAEMRNVAGELKGAMVAMEIALDKGIEILYLHYDYKGIEEWAKGNWKTNKEGTKGYKGFYDSIKEKLNVEFIKVLAHSGVKYNEEADKLAKEALGLN